MLAELPAKRAARRADAAGRGRLELSSGSCWRRWSPTSDHAPQRRRAGRGDGRAGRAAAPRRSTRRREPSGRSWSCASRCRPRATKLLSAIDPDELLTSEPYRRAARHLTGRARLAAGRPAARRRAARVTGRATWSRAPAAPARSSADQLEHARLVLELGRLERAIRRARARGRRGSATWPASASRSVRRSGPRSRGWSARSEGSGGSPTAVTGCRAMSARTYVDMG